MMKKIFLPVMLLCLMAACNQPAEVSETKDAPAASLPAIPYEIGHAIDNWTPGDMNHIAMVMNSLKAWETGDLDKSISYFADSVELNFDYYDATVPKDSLKVFFAQGKEAMPNVVIKMDDCESVISKDGKREYVSLWYKQIWTKDGKTDSLEVMNDARISNGKIVSLSEKTRHYGAKK